MEELEDLDRRWENLKIVDNFLPQGSFDELQRMIVDNHSFPLYVETNVSSDEISKNDTSAWSWYASHVLYGNDEVRSTWYSHIMKYFIDDSNLTPGGKFLSHNPLLIKAMMRVKVNFYPYCETFHKHPYHTDQDFSHQGAIFALNTCNGFTEFEDGTKIDSVENRLFLFDPSVKHRSTNTTDAMGRFNINFNFF